VLTPLLNKLRGFYFAIFEGKYFVMTGNIAIVICLFFLMIQENSNPERLFTAMEDSSRFVAERERLSLNFTLKYDEFTKTGWYKHKLGPQPHQTSIKAHVKTDGFCYLESIYLSTNWIFHDKIMVRIKDSVITSKTPSLSSDLIDRYVYFSKIKEELSLIENDNGILNFIAKANINETVFVRLVGESYHHDYRLKKRHQIAIKEAFRYAELIRAQKK
jgi:hypothetical protein